jgi:hypothetical protein
MSTLTSVMDRAPSPALAFTAVFGLLGGVVALTLLAGPVTLYLEATTAQIHDRTGYVAAVLSVPDNAPEVPDTELPAPAEEGVQP